MLADWEQILKLEFKQHKRYHEGIKEIGYLHVNSDLRVGEFYSILIIEYLVIVPKGLKMNNRRTSYFCFEHEVHDLSKRVDMDVYEYSLKRAQEALEAFKQLPKEGPTDEST